MKSCPECKERFEDARERCPRHDVELQPVAADGLSDRERLEAALRALPAPPPDADETLIGTILDGRYYLEEKLGEGGMGVVFKAHHTVIERPVAVKILKRDVARDKAVVQRFVQEAKAASRIGHAAIVDVFDFGTLPDGSAYQVMEFIPGETLAKALKAGPMTASRALPIVGQMARALAAAHDKGIVHRDLKPENIFLVDRDGRPDVVKIVDFGIAKFTPLGTTLEGPRLTRAGAVFGTPEYMAPEQAAGRGDSDHRVDIYALGIILYEMLVGRVPHKADSVVATLAQQMLDPIPPPREANPAADLSDDLERVLFKALAKDRAQRYRTMGELWEALDQASGGIPLEPLSAAESTRMMVPFATGAHTLRESTLSARPLAAGAASSTVVEELPVGAAVARGRRRAVLGAIAAAAVVGGALAFALGTRGSQPAGVPSAVDEGAPQLAATTPVVTPVPGLTALADAAPAAAVTGPPDAGLAPALRGDPDEGTRPRPPGEEMVEVLVVTRPAGASLYVGELLAGTHGTSFRRPRGTRLPVRCVLAGGRYDPGAVTVRFDGKKREVTCRLKKRSKCIDDLKNPFEKCP